MRKFHLVRTEDVSGVSGTGLIAEGVEFHDGQTVLSWFGQHHTIEILPKLTEVLKIHGHEGRTTIKWLEGQDRSSPTSGGNLDRESTPG